MSETSEVPENIEYVVTVKKRTPLQRLGCGLMIVVWLLVMMLPMVMIVLAVEGEIIIAHTGDVPDKHEHPRLRVDLIMEIDYRGLQITNSTIARDGETNICIQTNVRYLLWQGEGDPARFCDCYMRPGAEADWSLESTVTESCS